MSSRSLSDVLRTARARRWPALVVDIKRRSPRDGELIADHRLDAYLQALIDGGVDALSTPTDAKNFGGSVGLAARIRQLTDLPVLRKDYFHSIEQLEESVEAGFDSVQLSLSTVDRRRLPILKARAEELGLGVVLGVHGRQQLLSALELDAQTVGINNRNISMLELDDGTVADGNALTRTVPDAVLVLSESAFSTVADVLGAAEAGADGVLMGTAIAKSADPAGLVSQLREGMRQWGQRTGSMTASAGVRPLRSALW